jgi:flagellar biosynthesis activator protein FlaF
VTAHFAAARSVYARPEAPQKTPRSLEYELLGRITKRLNAADASKSGNYSELLAAMDENLRLWATLACDVADSGNGLPAKLRAQLFYLYEFIRQHSRVVRDGKGAVKVLIEINTAVMRGLRGEGGAP